MMVFRIVNIYVVVTSLDFDKIVTCHYQNIKPAGMHFLPAF